MTRTETQETLNSLITAEGTTFLTVAIEPGNYDALSLLNKWFKGQIDPLPGISLTTIHYSSLSPKLVHEQTVKDLAAMVIGSLVHELTKHPLKELIPHLSEPPPTRKVVATDQTYHEVMTVLNTLRYRQSIDLNEVPDVMRPDLLTFLASKGIKIGEQVSNYNYMWWLYNVINVGVAYPIKFQW